MMKKYADQDDDEREMRLALLGAKQVKGGFDTKKHDKGFTEKDSQMS